MCFVRVVLASLSDVSCDRRGGTVAAGPDCRDASSSGGQPADQYAVRQLHGDLRSMPRVRASLPERRAIWTTDGGHSVSACRHGHDHPLVATMGIRNASTPPCAAGRIHHVGGWSTTSIDSGSPRPWSDSCTPWSQAAIYRTGCLAVDRLCDGCLATPDSSQHGLGTVERWSHLHGSQRRIGLLWSTARSRRPSIPSHCSGQKCHPVDARIKPDRRQLCWLRCNAQRLRTSHRHRGGDCF